MEGKKRDIDDKEVTEIIIRYGSYTQVIFQRHFFAANNAGPGVYAVPYPTLPIGGTLPMDSDKAQRVMHEWFVEDPELLKILTAKEWTDPNLANNPLKLITMVLARTA